MKYLKRIWLTSVVAILGPFLLPANLIKCIWQGEHDSDTWLP